MTTKEEVLMKGTHAAIIQSAKENFDVEDCICELVDNAIDSQATKVNIGFDENEDGKYSFHFDDNGHGMNYDMVTKIFSNFKSHIVHPNRAFECNRVGIKGEGMKYALLGMIESIHQDSRSQIHIETSIGDDVITIVEWNISTCNAMEEDFRHPIITKRKNTKGLKGTLFVVNNCEYHEDIKKNLGKIDNSLLYINRFENALSQRYALLLDNGLTIRYLDHTITGWDRLHLNMLPHDAKDGLYVVSNFVFYVKTANLYSAVFNDTISVKYIIFYAHGTDKRHYEAASQHGGIYAVKGNRYILCGSTNSKSVLGEQTTNLRKNVKVNGRSGPEGRIRTCLFFDNSNSEIFGIYTNKSKGVASLSRHNGYKETYMCTNGRKYDNTPTTLCDNVILDRNRMFDFRDQALKYEFDEKSIVDFFETDVDYINFNGKEINPKEYNVNEPQQSVEKAISTCKEEIEIKVKNEEQKNDNKKKLVKYDSILNKYDYSEFAINNELKKQLSILEFAINLSNLTITDRVHILSRYIKKYWQKF